MRSYKQTESFKISTGKSAQPAGKKLQAETVSDYDLYVEDLRQWLQKKWPNEDFSNITNRNEKYRFYVPEPLTKDDRDIHIAKLRKPLDPYA